MPLICPHCNSQKIHYEIQAIFNIDGEGEKNLYTIICENGHLLGIPELRDNDQNKQEKKPSGMMQGVNKVEADRTRKAQEKMAANPLQQKEQPSAYKPIDNGPYGATGKNQSQDSNIDKPVTPAEAPEFSAPEADQSLE